VAILTDQSDKNKAALILGGSGDIGAATALRLAKDGYDIILAGRSVDRLSNAAKGVERLGSCVFTFAQDLREQGAAETLVSSAIAAAGRLDVLVCCAGEFKRGDLLSLTPQDWEDGFGAMFFGAVNVVRASWPHLKVARGRIVMISGVFAHKPPAAGALPGVLAAAVLNFTKSAADLGLRDGISVNCVLPGPIAGHRLDENLERLAAERGLPRAEAEKLYARNLGIERVGKPEEVAEAISFLVSPSAAFVRGSSLVVDGGNLRVL
jgi:3-oxoacyl-[acyl-carrier protein] reductase